MTRLHTAPVAEATGSAAELFVAIKASAGMVPQAYIDIGSNSPAALEAALHLDAALRRSSLPAQDAELVKLVVSEVNRCDYCLAAHTLLGKKTGLTAERILAVRRGLDSGDARVDALAAFVRQLAEGSGTLPAHALAAIQAAGYSDAQIVDIVLAMTAITLTNLFNRVNDTVIDFPPAD